MDCLCGEGAARDGVDGVGAVRGIECPLLFRGEVAEDGEVVGCEGGGVEDGAVVAVLVECGFVDGESVGIIEGTGVEGWEDAAREGGVATRDKEVSKAELISTSIFLKGNPSETQSNSNSTAINHSNLLGLSILNFLHISRCINSLRLRIRVLFTIGLPSNPAKRVSC